MAVKQVSMMSCVEGMACLCKLQAPTSRDFVGILK